MAPIRVALVGLSASAKATWAADAHLPYLLSTRGRQHYELVVVLNSSVEAAESAKATFDLSPSVKAYGDPAKPAADSDIDLVVVNTRTDVHLPVVEPSVRAALELTGGKRYANSIVGLQGRVVPLTLRLKEILVDSVIGKVLNSEVRAYGNLLPRDSLPECLMYLADRDVGVHPVNIHYGYLIDYVHEVLGDWEDFHAVGQIRRPSLKVLGADGQEPGSVKSNVPDVLSVHGTLKNNKGVTRPRATLLATFRLGPQFKGEPGLTWTINGEKGKLRLTAPGPYLQAGYSFDGPITIAHHNHVTDAVTELGWDWPDWQKEYGLRARSTAELFERYADWIEVGRPNDVPEEKQWPRLEDGVALLGEFDKLYKQIDPEW